MPGYSKEWRRLAAKIKAQTISATCWICGEGIDMGLPRNHGKDFTLDHLVPKLYGGLDVESNCAPAHRSCNTRRRHRVMGSEGQPKNTFHTTQEW